MNSKQIKEDFFLQLFKYGNFNLQICQILNILFEILIKEEQQLLRGDSQ